MHGRDFAHVQDGVNRHIVHMYEGIFSLHADQIYFYMATCNCLRVLIDKTSLLFKIICLNQEFSNTVKPVSINDQISQY